MNTILLMLLTGAAGFFAATRNVRRAVDERIGDLEKRLRETREQPAAPVQATAAVEKTVQPAPEPAPQPVAAAPTAVPAQQITPETVMLISAAIAAFLGKKAKIRRITRIAPTGFNPWSQQGRVSIQASHQMWSRRAGE